LLLLHVNNLNARQGLEARGCKVLLRLNLMLLGLNLMLRLNLMLLGLHLVLLKLVDVLLLLKNIYMFLMWKLGPNMTEGGQGVLAACSMLCLTWCANLWL
jgi:hypothetical protein